MTQRIFWKSAVSWTLRVAFLWSLLFALWGCPADTTCQEDNDCAQGTFCNTTAGQCISQCKADSDCADGKPCQIDRGRCGSNTAKCTPKARKGCVGDKVYWFDSCGYQGEKVEECGQQGCTDGACNPGNPCGNGKCEPGSEDCLSCPEDCKCGKDENCKKGLCVKECGDGTCNPASEDCTTCAVDCRCASGQICASGKCEKQESCGNGKCDKDKNEDCSTCPLDCGCATGEVCVGDTCQKACGNGRCDAGENCSTCAQDCKCQEGQRCNLGKCETTCGNGKCESSYGENCSTCAKDCKCPSGMDCKSGQCGTLCGNGKCDADKGENCSTCAKDCACATSRFCSNGKCSPWCGNGVCDAARNETCATCAIDCQCPNGSFCDRATTQCKAYCGDGKCDATKGENCGTCAKDCGCKTGESCINGKCGCVPDCKGKVCGDDGCGGSCGTCSGRTSCNNGKCECKDECKDGDSNCLGSSKYERCVKDADGCLHLKVLSCQNNQVCNNGSCCSSGCGTKECGDDGCGGTCGTCGSRATCSSGKCVCKKNECSAANTQVCSSSGSYKECLRDANGCLYWSTIKSCGSGRKCVSDKCCTPVCSGRECGSDGCGGSCGSCKHGCTSNRCRRKAVFGQVTVSRDVCNDDFTFIKGSPDIFVRISFTGGPTYNSPRKDGATSHNFNFPIPTYDPIAANSVKVEVLDYDSLNSNDTCASFTVDLTKPGTRTYTDTGRKNAKITITVEK